MKRLFFLLILLSCLISVDVEAQPVTTYTNFSTAISTIGATQKSLFISSSYSLSSNVTVPSTLHLHFLKGGSITLGDYDLTINGPLTACECLIFIYNGTGRVTLNGPIYNVYYQWWNDDIYASTASAGLTNYILYLSTGIIFNGSTSGLSIPDASTTVKGKASFEASDFNVASGHVTLDYTNVPTNLGLGTGDSPVFVTTKLSGLTDGYVPYHVSDSVGLGNSGLYVGSGDGLGIWGGVAGGSFTIGAKSTSNGNIIITPFGVGGGLFLNHGGTSGNDGVHIYNGGLVNELMEISSSGVKLGGTVTASDGVGVGLHLKSTLTASANGDILGGGYYSGSTIATGTYTGLTYYGHYIGSPSHTGTGTVSDKYGLFISNVTGGTRNFQLTLQASDLYYKTSFVTGSQTYDIKYITPNTVTTGKYLKVVAEADSWALSWDTPTGSGGTSGVSFTVPGTAVAGTSVSSEFIVTAALTITKAYAYIRTAATGTTGTPITGKSLVFDIDRSEDCDTSAGTPTWTTIWSTQANRLSISDGYNSGTQTSFNTATFSEGDCLRLNIDYVGSTLPGSDITVQLK